MTWVRSRLIGDLIATGGGRNARGEAWPRGLRWLGLLAVAFSCTLLFPDDASAATRTWDGEAGTQNWGDALNWSPNGVPTSSDDVELTGVAPVHIDVDASANNVTVDNPSLVVTVLATNTLTVGGSYTHRDGTFDGGSGSVDIDGSFVQTGGSFVAPSGTLSVARNFSQSGPATFDANGGTVSFDGGYKGNTSVDAAGVVFAEVAISRSTSSSSNLVFTVAAGTTLPLGDAPVVSLVNTYNTYPNYNRLYQLVNNGTMDVGTGVFAANVDGPFTNNGTIITETDTKTNSFGSSYINAPGSAVEFRSDGDAAADVQTITQFATSYGHLVVNLTDGDLDSLQLDSDATVAGTLNLSNGSIITGEQTLSIAATGSVVRTSGHVVGNLRKALSAGAPVRTFEIGDATSYTPVEVSLAAVTTGGTLTASSSMGDHASIGTSAIDPTRSVDRTWALTNEGIVFGSADVTLHFHPSDPDGGSDASVFRIGTYSGGTWSYPTVGTRTATSTQGLGINGFGDFQIGQHIL